MPVVDASVALKWFVEEPDSDRALGLRDSHVSKEEPLLAPDLLIYEVANALLHNPRFTGNEVSRAIQSLYDLQLELVTPTPDLIERAIHLASRHRLSFYDALYVALAQELDLKLITADRQMQRKVASFSFVQLLA